MKRRNSSEMHVLFEQHCMRKQTVKVNPHPSHESNAFNEFIYLISSLRKVIIPLKLGYTSNVVNCIRPTAQRFSTNELNYFNKIMVIKCFARYPLYMERHIVWYTLHYRKCI